MSRFQFAHYVFDGKADLLGEGSYAEIYRAFDTQHQRHVALKILRPRLEIDPHAYERFEREARYMTTLAHPSIPTVYEYGDYQGRRYFTMEYILGITLHELIQRKPLEIEDGIHISVHLAETLAFLHGKGFLHLDLKPKNIMVLENHNIKLLDFGVSLHKKDIPLFKEGFIMLSVQYAAPEAIIGERIDKWSDVFSYGAVLYHAFTGRVPFPGGNFEEVYTNILGGKLQRPSELRQDLPACLDEFIMRCMRHIPFERYRNGIEVQRALEEICHDLERK